MTTIDHVGRYENRCHIDVHTHQAKHLINGSHKKHADNKRYTVVGLVLFARLVKKIWYRSQADDPYADIVLMEIERRLEKADKQLSTEHHRLDKKLNGLPAGFQVALNQSSAPALLSLGDSFFSTPHARWGGALISTYDLLIRKLDTAKSIPNVIRSTDYERCVRRSTRVVRGAFCAVLTYKNLSVTRADLLEPTELGQRAITQLGWVPSTVLSNEMGPQYRPKRQTLVGKANKTLPITE